jgi:glutamate/tyrosine decarboxylase-like PLP-dependent enzyme
MANLMAVLVARNAALGSVARHYGIGNEGALLTAYTSQAAHGCVSRAMDIAGLGTDALRKIGVDADHRLDVEALRAQIAVDREVGFRPFLVVASAGTVDVGAIDDLEAIAKLCREEGLWFHVDGAFGALAIFSPELASLLGGIELADSIALDFHKWGQVPYDAGFLLVRDGEQHRQAFAQPAAYLRREARGLAAGAVWPCDLGPDLSRGFRALKTWFTLKTFGTDLLGATIARSCALAKYLEARVLAEPRLELLAPVNLNIVCFRYRADDAVNREIVADIQESGVAAPSSTTLNGRFAIRAAIVNHRTEEADIDALVAAVLEFGGRRRGDGMIEVDAPPLAAD